MLHLLCYQQSFMNHVMCPQVHKNLMHKLHAIVLHDLPFTLLPHFVSLPPHLPFPPLPPSPPFLRLSFFRPSLPVSYIQLEVCVSLHLSTTPTDCMLPRLTKLCIVGQFPHSVVRPQVQPTQLPSRGTVAEDILTPGSEVSHVHNRATLIGVYQ